MPVSDSGLRIAIVGAGIGRLPAVAFLPGKGSVATVYEQAPALTEVGVGMPGFLFVFARLLLRR